MKILIVGSSGQLGHELMDILKSGHCELGKIDGRYSKAEVIGTNSSKLNITNKQAVDKFFEELMPDIVINCAAYTNVDACESNEDDAFMVNSIGPRNLAAAAQKIGAKLVHISTDYVFNGCGSVPYREYDVPNPVSVYGKTKLLGETYVEKFCSRFFIVRTSWLYGLSGKNFVKTILKASKDKGHLEVVDDQRGNPTNAEDLSYHILKLALTDGYGIYHCTGNGECSWYDFAKKIVEYAGIPCTVDPIKSDKLTRAAKRPSFSSLENMMLRCTVKDEMRNWQDALKSFIAKLGR